MAENLLEITVVKATDIADVKAWEWGKQDPYAIVAYNQYEFRTKTDEDAGKSPHWNETFSFCVESNPVLTLTVMHDRKKHDDIIGTAKLPFIKAYEAGCTTDVVPLFTTEGKQQGFLEVVLRFPAVAARVDAQLAAAAAARQMDLLRLEEAKAVYAEKLKEALGMRQQSAERKARAQEGVIDGSVASMAVFEALDAYKRQIADDQAAFMAASSDKLARFLKEVDVDEMSFEVQLNKEIEDAAEFEPEISVYVGAVAAAEKDRMTKLLEAKQEMDHAVGTAVGKYFENLLKVQKEFDVDVGKAASTYKKRAAAKVHWLEEAKAEHDVVAYKPR